MAASETTHDKSRNGTKSAAAIRPAPLHWRIKLYELEEEGSWIDKGTGFVHCKIISEMGGPVIVIRSEENDGVIFFQSKVHEEDVYEIQGGICDDSEVDVCTFNVYVVQTTLSCGENPMRTTGRELITH
jgi:hypothetical protein